MLFSSLRTSRDSPANGLSGDCWGRLGGGLVTQPLIRIHGLIGNGDQGVGVFGIPGKVATPKLALRLRSSPRAHFDGGFPHGFLDAANRFPGQLIGGVRQNDKELIAGVAYHGIVVSYVTAKDFGEDTERAVALLVTIGVVDVFETVKSMAIRETGRASRRRGSVPAPGEGRSSEHWPGR